MNGKRGASRRHGNVFALALLSAGFAGGATAQSRGAVDLGTMVDARYNLKSSYTHALGARGGALGARGSQVANDTAAIAGANRRLLSAMPALRLDVSGLTGAPTSMINERGALTGANRGASSETIARNFLLGYGDAFGLSVADLSDLATLGDSAGGDSGLRMLRMEQRVGDRAVFQSETRFLIDKDGRLIKVTGQLVPHARDRIARAGGTELSAQEGLVSLLGVAGKAARTADFTATRTDGDLLRFDSANEFALGEVTARQVYFPLAPGVLVPAWSFVVFTPGEQDWYAVVDAETGDLLWRKNIRESVSTQDARFRVYVQADGTTPADSPAPQSPSLAVTGNGTQVPEIAPTIVSMLTAQDAIASPNGWINDCPAGGCTANETQTLGNNSVVCMDQVTTGGNANICDTAAATVLDGNGRPTGNPDANARNRDFLGTAPRDFQTGFLPPPQAGNPEAGQTATGNGNNGTLAIDQFRRGMVTHLFYLTNWYHDKLYRLGFDEAAGNFQATNFSGMGLGNDRVNGDADDGSGTNNANFSTPPDGTSGRMQMFRFTGPTIDRDGGLDAEIVLHELTHGTSNRLVGNGAGLNWDPARGMGEGWSDFYALSLLNNTNADTPTARFASGAYATYKLGGLLDNYVYGIRRFPYSTDNTVNPLTWADVDDVTYNEAGGIPVSPLGFGGNGGMEVHNIGEIWANTLWEVRSRVIADPAGANGNVPTGNTTMLRLVTNGLKMTPVNPTFIQARDAILQADCATNACANEASIWGGFADRGLGYKSAAPFNIVGRYVSSHAGVTESFNLPYLDVVNAATDVVIDDSADNNNGTIDPGEAIKITAKLTNPWRAAGKSIASATAVLSTSTPGVTIYDANSSYGAIAAQGSAVGDSFTFTVDPSVPCGSAIDFTLTVTSSLGTTATTFRLRVGAASGTDPAVTYTGTPSPALTINNRAPRGSVHQINVTDDFVIADLNFRLDSVTTPAAGDLSFLLRSPQGVGTDLVTLIDGLNDLGGTAITGMVIDDDVANDAAHDMVQATTANSPYTASWQPVYNAPWAALVNAAVPADTVPNLTRYDGLSTKGSWSVLGADLFSAATGGADGNSTLTAWSMIVTPVHFACTAFAPGANVSASKTVTGTFRVGNTVTYTVVLTNNGTALQADNAGNEFTDVLPAGLTLVSATASAGTATATVGTNTVTWNGTIAPLAASTVTITITATINAGAQNTSISNQGAVSYDSDNNGSNDASRLTDDPGVGGATDPTVFTVGGANLAATKTVAGTFAVGSTVTYTVTVSNTGNTASADNAGNEFTDVLPSQLTLVSATASSGTAVATLGTNTVTWNGAVAAAGSVTITITATVNAGVVPGTSVSNQGNLSFDADLNGSNETSRPTDDPAVGGAADPTVFVSQGAIVAATKTVAGTYAVGSTVTYTVVLSNTGNATAADNAGNEFTDVLPSTLNLVSATASSGTAVATVATRTVTWNGAVAAGGSVTITITATLTAVAPNTTVSNQGSVSYDADLNGSNETTKSTDDPLVGGSADPTSFVSQGAIVTATKTVAGQFFPMGMVTYTIRLSNSGNASTADNAGNEFTDVLPAGLTLVSATASGGTAVATVGTNTVTWNGAIPTGSNVITISIVAMVKATSGSTTISNQATVIYDADLNGTNETTVMTDDPATPATPDTTSFVAAAGQSGAFVPSLSDVGRILMALVLVGLALTTLRRKTALR